MICNLENKKIFLTGSSRGIGKTIRNLLEKDGGIVICPTRKDLDLSDEKSVTTYLQDNKDLEIDIIIHCAGLNILAGIDEVTSEIMNDVLQVNLLSIIQILKTFVPNMKATSYGKVVLLSSIYSTVTRERRIAYTSSKNAVVGLTKTLALELAPYNIMVNCVSPGYVMTEMTKQNLNDLELKDILEKIPTRRFQTEEEIYKAVRFLISDDNQSITGQNLTVDGGFICR